MLNNQEIDKAKYILDNLNKYFYYQQDEKNELLMSRQFMMKNLEAHTYVLDLLREGKQTYFINNSFEGNK